MYLCCFNSFLNLSKGFVEIIIIIVIIHIMINIIIRKSHNKNKKWDAVFNNSKVIPFGAAGYSDYTINKNPIQRANYLKRHSNEDWTRTNIESAAWLSRWLLWEKQTLSEAIKHAHTVYRGVKFSLYT